MPGGKGRPWTARLVDRSQAVARRVAHPHVTALSALTAGMAALAIGRWKTASDLCEQALITLRDRCTGVTWELNTAQNFLLGALLYQGALRDVSTRLPPLLADARARGNLYVETELCTRMNLVWLAADQPDEGERQAIASIGRWSQKGFHRQHYSATLARVQTDLYRGNAAAAWSRIIGCWPALSHTLLMRAQVVRVEALYLRARCALAMALDSPDPGRFLPTAEEAARRIAREGMPWTSPIALLVSAAVASLKGDVERSARQLGDSAGAFDLAGMHLYAAVARRRLAAHLVGDQRGRELQRQSDEWMVSQNIRNPAFMTRMLAPGFPEPA
jgi:eukaryotic-like serine/threonine-protein kinase